MQCEHIALNGFLSASASTHMHYAKLCNTASLQSTPRPVTVDAIDFRPMGYGEAMCIKHLPRTGVI